MAVMAGAAVVATVLVELTTASPVRADPVYPITEADKALVIWGHALENKGLIGYLMIARAGPPRIYGVWRRGDGSIVIGQMPHNSVPIGFIRDEPESAR
jgi:hypothetical protein